MLSTPIAVQHRCPLVLLLAWLTRDSVCNWPRFMATAAAAAVQQPSQHEWHNTAIQIKTQHPTSLTKGAPCSEATPKFRCALPLLLQLYSECALVAAAAVCPCLCSCQLLPCPLAMPTHPSQKSTACIKPSAAAAPAAVAAVAADNWYAQRCCCCCHH